MTTQVLGDIATARGSSRSKHDMVEFDLDDRGPERGQSEPGLRASALAADRCPSSARRSGDTAAKQIRPAPMQHHDLHLDEVNGQQRGEDPEGEPAPGCRIAGPSWSSFGKAQDHDGHDQRVVGAEEAFEDDEQSDGDEVGAAISKTVFPILPWARVKPGLPAPTLTRSVSSLHS